ncbi:MAG: Fe-S oxidoreductase [Motiliproteus sp.]|jgi:Fe-S oxidoreductase
MVFEWLHPVLIATALLLAAVGAVRRVNLWRAGQPDAVDLVAGIIAMPGRYLHDLHAVVERDPYMSKTHVATAGGFVLSLVMIVLVHLLGLESQVLAWALLASLVLMFVGALFVFKRRLTPPSRLSKGPWMRLPKSLLAFAGAFFILTLPMAGVLPEDFLSSSTGGLLLTVILSIFIAMGLAEMLLGMTWGGPMKHAFAGALHLAFHRRPERFGGGRSTGLKPVALDQRVLGVQKPEDFKWTQLLGFDACVQCGKCEAACPAFAAGQPLNPKKLIQDMVVGMAGGTDAQYAGSPYPGKEVGGAKGGPLLTITQGLIDPDTLWSCTTCRACVEECPMMIEHVDAIVDMRRFLTMEKGSTPNKGAEVLDNLIATDNPNGHAPTSRMNWAADQNLPLLRDVKETDVIFWVSDGAFDMRSQRILRAFVTLLKAANVDFAVLGDEELDSGDVARRLGDDATFQSLATRNIATLRQYKFKRIVTTDPHAYHCLRNEYADFADGLFDNVEVLHHTTYLNDLVQSGRIKLNRYKGGTVTYHDPCYLGRYNGEYEAPRELLRSMGIEIAEMERSGSRSRCCGGGGGAPITDVPGKRRIADMRMEDVQTTGAELIAVGCQQCTAMLEGVVEPRPEVKDIAEILVGSLVEPHLESLAKELH